MKLHTEYPFAVWYIENGVENFDHWTADTLNTELNRREVQIVHIELAISGDSDE